ncbi:neuromedin-B receptor-like [Acanthaster planci]|uniref:Neuromedin-B receptor-like n=1 Tax=Acanthaster planci TaxID=133434 RepID=A0A8B7XRL7_ACAPL|nr:neuromedin-B receptor-like [Acanthaster planci]XP_022083485.1 neuromedin-B receptor-like [Acanthaster planci]XP_022083486.1 neuromedin-B receptor-like [Acanthaster planci]XP_022083487.1 neuromedin-B receptor-like [Acanthaster planci]XP_022083489.1 neuromedin-B receptor-like [Acanthaster planci]
MEGSYLYYSYNLTNTTHGDSTTHPLRLGVAVFVVILSLVGLVGNVCMVYAILGHRHMRTLPNVLILNLAVADLLYILITTPIHTRHELNPNWHLDEAACKVKNYLAFVAQHASVFALAALSRERHTAIVGGMEARHRGAVMSWLSSSRCAVSTLWLAALTVSVPTLVFAHVQEKQCRYSSSDPTLSKAYECVHFLVGYLIPLFIVGIYYMRIAVSLFRSTHSFQNEYMGDAMAKQVRVRKRLAFSVLVITIFFAVCWFPYFYYYLWINFTPQEDFLIQPFPHGTDILRYVGFVMPVINTGLDPWILFGISSRHRACLVRCLTARACGCKKVALRKRDSLSMRTMTTSRKADKQRTTTGAGTSFSRLSNA